MPPPLLAALFDSVELVIVTLPTKVLWMPPPALVAEFPESVLLVISSVPLLLRMAPPVAVRLAVTVLLISFAVPAFQIPAPPPGSLPWRMVRPLNSAVTPLDTTWKTRSTQVGQVE